jgi:hypothetical protein
MVGEELAYAVACVQHQLFQLRRYPRAKVLVNGTQKTGTTWMVRMLSSVPGFRSVGNFRGDIDRYLDVRRGDVVHGHDRYTQRLIEALRSNQIQVVLMVRDPRDVTVSRMYHVKRDITHRWHHRMARMNHGDALMACIEGRSGLPGLLAVASISRSWLEAGTEACCVRYEDLTADPMGELARVLEFLGIGARPLLIRAIVARTRFERLTAGRRIWKPGRTPGVEDSSSHFRKGIVGEWKNHFDAAHVRRLKEVAGQLLIDWGYERDSEW